MKEVELNWGPLICECEECVCQTLVQFREQGNPTFYTPTSPDNPTQTTTYKILIDENTYYQVRLTFIGPRCQEKYTEFSLFFPESSCCPAGYTLAPDASYCYKIEDVAATPPSGAVETLVARTHGSYSTCGTWIYDPGYNIDGTGSSTKITVSNDFWKNGAGGCTNIGTLDGPLNRTGVWVGTNQDDQDIGFGVCVNLSETTTYYVGLATDNYGILRIDGDTIIQQDVVALGTQYGQDAQVAFKIWHVYPIQLSAGPHIIEILGHNISGVAAVGCEIYNATAAELISATSYGDLGSKLIFSSKDYIGEPVQIGTGDVGYTCPEGYTLASCEDPVVCRRILNTSPTTC